MDKKKVIAGLALLIAGGVFYWWHNKNKATKAQSQEPTKVVQQPRTNISSPALVEDINNIVQPPLEKSTLPVNNPIQSSPSVIDNQLDVIIGGGSGNSGVGSSVRCGNNNCASGNYSGVLSGINNTASGNYSTVSGGYNNVASCCYSTVSGGYNNVASCYSATVSGGRNNTASGYSATVSGGLFNTAQAYAGFIGSGIYNNVCNTTCSNYAVGAVVVGGVGNNTTGGTWNNLNLNFTDAPTMLDAGAYSFIGGGFQNRAGACYSSVGGGRSNISSCLYSTISGGYCNTASCNYSTISGGVINVASGIGSTVAGGEYNIACGKDSTVVGGNTNTASGYASVIGGGVNNIATANYSAILGGHNNNISTTASVYSSIINGLNNTISGYQSAILVGNTNTVSANYSLILGGSCNTVSGNYSVIVNGLCNNVSANYAGVFGYQITNDCACSFMSNQLRACNIFGAGAICANAGGTIVPVVSDSRLKQDISPLNYGLCDIMCLNPVSYNWNEKAQKDNGCLKQIGFVAQQIKEVIPESVYKTASGYYGFDSSKLIPVLTIGIKELKSCNDSLQLQINTLNKILNNKNLA